MITQTDRVVNTPVVIVEQISTTTQPTDLVLLLDANLNTTPVVFTNLNTAGLSKFSFTPTVTGTYTLFGDGKVLATVEVTSRSLRSFMQNLEDESLGSWTWNKTTGAMQMLRQDGTLLASFNVIDNLNTSSRERI
jgi:hypothetical protein